MKLPIIDGTFRKQRDKVLDRLDEVAEKEADRQAKLERSETIETGMTLAEIERGEHDDKPLDLVVDRFDRAIARAREKNPGVVIELVQARERLINRRTRPGEVITIESLVATIEAASKEGEEKLFLDPKQAAELLVELAGMARMTGHKDYERRYRRVAYEGNPVGYVNQEIRELFGVRLHASHSSPKDGEGNPQSTEAQEAIS